MKKADAQTSAFLLELFYKLNKPKHQYRIHFDSQQTGSSLSKYLLWYSGCLLSCCANIIGHGLHAIKQFHA